MDETNFQKANKGGAVSEFISIDGAGKLSKIKAYFVLGDWGRVINFGSEALKSQELTKDEIDLANIYIACALMQKHEMEQSKLIIERIKDLSGVRSELSSLIVSNCYDILGRVSLLIPNSKEAPSYFRKSASVLGLKDCDLAARFRYINACFDYGQNNDIATALSSEIDKHPTIDYTLQEARLETLEEKQSEILTRIEKSKALTNKNEASSREKANASLVSLIEQGLKPVVLIAGMRHCGSTALFNLVRLSLNHLGYTVFSGYSETIETDSFKDKEMDCTVIKIHEIRDDLEELADFIICPVRDIRDTIASAKRREFPMLKNMGLIGYSKYNRMLSQTWSEYEDYCFHYENYITTPRDEVKHLFRFLGVSEALVDEIISEVNHLPTDQYNETLLSRYHITDSKRELTYFDTLSTSEIKEITSLNSSWLKKYGYEC